MTKSLLSVVLVGYCQFLTTFCAARSQYATTILCGHSLTEAVLVHSSPVVRLKCSFHLLNLLLLCYFPCQADALCRFWAAKLRISFELPKNYAFFHEKFYVFFHFLRNFAAENGSFCKKDIHITNHITL
jgi:hypothetical protein